MGINSQHLVEESTSKIRSGGSALQLDESGEEDRSGSWQRRRRIDGSLLRVPPGFYARVWDILEFVRLGPE